MNLIVDIGNTFIKVAQFEHGNCIDIERFKDQRLFLEYSSSLSVNNAIISSVREKTIIKMLGNKFDQALVLNHTTALPISNLYHTPETLGNDRLANAVGAFNAFPYQNTLTIDAGTCIKFDFINTNNEYLGGSISPGLKMRFNALHTLTDNLPLIDDVEINQLIGADTTSSIQVGVYQGIIAEISNMISQYERKYDNLNIILTGGDLRSFLDIELSQKNSIFADEFHTLKGLNTILNYNVQK
jgi:type III pantothenate kinase